MAKDKKNPRKKRKRRALYNGLKKTGKLGFKVGRKVTIICVVAAGFCLVTTPILSYASQSFPVLDRFVPIPKASGNLLKQWIYSAGTIYYEGSWLYTPVAKAVPATLPTDKKLIKVIQLFDKPALENMKMRLSAVSEPGIDTIFHNLLIPDSALNLYNRWNCTAGSLDEGARIFRRVPIRIPTGIFGVIPPAIYSFWVPKSVPETIIGQWKDMSIFKIRTTTGVLQDPDNLISHLTPLPEIVKLHLYTVTNEEWYVLLSEAFAPSLNRGRIFYGECFELMKRYQHLIQCTRGQFIEDYRRFKEWIPTIKRLLRKAFKDIIILKNQIIILKNQINSLIKQCYIAGNTYNRICRNPDFAYFSTVLTYTCWAFGTRTIVFCGFFFPIVKDNIVCVSSYIYNLSSALYPVILRIGPIFAKDCNHFRTKILPLIPVEYPVPYSLKVLVNNIIDSRRRLNLNIIYGLKFGGKKILLLTFDAIVVILSVDIRYMLAVSTHNIILPFNFRKIFTKIFAQVLAVKLQKQLFVIVPVIIDSQTDRFLVHYFDLELGEKPTSLSTLFKESTLVLLVTSLPERFERLLKNVELVEKKIRFEFLFLYQAVYFIFFGFTQDEEWLRLVAFTERMLEENWEKNKLKYLKQLIVGFIIVYLQMII